MCMIQRSKLKIQIVCGIKLKLVTNTNKNFMLFNCMDQNQELKDVYLGSVKPIISEHNLNNIWRIQIDLELFNYEYNNILWRVNIKKNLSYPNFLSLRANISEFNSELAKIFHSQNNMWVAKPEISTSGTLIGRFFSPLSSHYFPSSRQPWLSSFSSSFRLASKQTSSGFHPLQVTPRELPGLNTPTKDLLIPLFHLQFPCSIHLHLTTPPPKKNFSLPFRSQTSRRLYFHLTPKSRFL